MVKPTGREHGAEPHRGAVRTWLLCGCSVNSIINPLRHLDGSARDAMPSRRVCKRVVWKFLCFSKSVTQNSKASARGLEAICVS